MYRPTIDCVCNKPFRHLGFRDRSDLNTLVRPTSTRIGRIDMSCGREQCSSAHWLLAQLRGIGLSRPCAPAHTTFRIGLLFGVVATDLAGLTACSNCSNVSHLKQ